MYPFLDETHQTMNTRLYKCCYYTKEVMGQDNHQNMLVLTVEYSKTTEDGFSSQSSLRNIVVLSSVSSSLLRETLYYHHEDKDHSGWSYMAVFVPPCTFEGHCTVPGAAPVIILIFSCEEHSIVVCK